MKDYETGLTQERVRELLSYDPTTGIFSWRVVRCGHKAGTGGTIKAGSVAGGNGSASYRRIGIDGVRYKAHRLVWMYVHGRWPAELIDHINGDRDDNRITNLREATKSENGENQRKAKAGTKTGILGICWHQEAKKFMASITVGGKQKYLGCFHTAEEAHQAYLVAKRELHSHCTI